MQDRVYKFWLADPVGESIKAGEGMTAGSHRQPGDHIFKHKHETVRVNWEQVRL